jgi:hypothetical protein
MFITTKIAAAVVLILGAASAALANQPKHRPERAGMAGILEPERRPHGQAQHRLRLLRVDARSFLRVDARSVAEEGSLGPTGCRLRNGPRAMHRELNT